MLPSSAAFSYTVSFSISIPFTKLQNTYQSLSINYQSSYFYTIETALKSKGISILLEIRIIKVSRTTLYTSFKGGLGNSLVYV